MAKNTYVPGASVSAAENALNEHKKKKPGAYESQWKASAEALLKKIQDRKEFSYDPGKDPLYRAAVDQHVRLGRKAMMDTVGKGAALTGGYGNSYALTAGQNAYGEYLQALTARLPDFQDRAMKVYALEGDDLKKRYDALSGREKEAQGRYEKILERYYGEQSRLEGALSQEKDRDYRNYLADRDFAYRQEQDRLAEAARAEKAKQEGERWKQKMDYEAERDRIRDQQWEKEFAEDLRRFELQWAKKHGGGSGGGSRNYPRYQDKHGLSEREYREKKKQAERNKHYIPASGGPRLPGNHYLTPHQKVPFL